MSASGPLAAGSERAHTALHLLILANVLVFAYRDEFQQHLALRRTYRVADGGDLRSMLLSIFYHADPTHLFLNMLALHRYGCELFVNTSSRRWRSVLVIFASYVFCGVGSFCGIEALSRYHEYQWEKRVDDARNAGRCSHWLCESLNEAFGGEDVSSFFTNAVADFATSLDFADVRLSMWYYRAAYRIGASGAVYGWMGMRLVTSSTSPHHSRLGGIDYFFLVATLANDLSKSPISLEDLRASVLLEGDGVDHAAHVTGAAFGMVWGLVLILWERAASFRLFRGRRWRQWGGGRNGRRLGTRSGEEQRTYEQQQQQRVQNSRLLNRRGSNRQSRDRTML